MEKSGRGEYDKGIEGGIEWLDTSKVLLHFEKIWRYDVAEDMVLRKICAVTLQQYSQ